MEDEVIVLCHAPVFSLLMFETARSLHDQKGLLIGQVFDEVISRQTDDNEGNTEHKTVIFITHCLPVTNPEAFGKVGDVNINELQKLIELKQIVGWYSFRRNIRVLSNTLCEMLIHKSLLEKLPDSKPEHFVAAFMSASVAPSLSTHTYNHIFTRYYPNRGRFEPLRLKICSLSDKSTNSSGHSVKNQFPLSSQFTRIINSAQNEETPVKSVLAVHGKIGNLLKLYNQKLQQTENTRRELEREVEDLKKQLGLNRKKDIVVKEEEPEKEEFPKYQFIQYNPRTRYNPNRNSNPIKVIDIEQLSPVPDDDDDDNDVVEVDDTEKDQKRYDMSKPERSYAAALSNKSPVFNPKTPKMRPGLSPQVNLRNSPASNNRESNRDSPDIIHSGDENEDNTDKKKAAVNNLQQNPQSMEY